jgi:hypothetical protein
MSKTFPKISTKISMPVFLDFFCFIAFSNVSQRWEFKNTTKNVFQKNRVEKFLQKIRQEIQNRLFLGFYFYYVFGRFSMRGVQKHDKKNREKNPTLVLFWYSDPPTHHGGHRFIFAGPLPLPACPPFSVLRPPSSPDFQSRFLKYTGYMGNLLHQNTPEMFLLKPIGK